MKPGYYKAEELSNADYHSGAGVSCSGLKLLARSPYHYWGRYLSPNRPKENFSKPRFIGTAIHAACLEPDVFRRDYVVAPYDARNAAGFKSWKLHDSGGRVILTRPEYLAIMGMRDSLLKNSVVGPLLEQAEAFELSCYGIDPETGVLVRVRLDCLCAGGWVLDLKKTQDASAAGALKAVQNYDYFMQAALYLDVPMWATGEQFQGMGFAFVEEEYPHASAIYCISEEDIARGRAMHRALLNTYARCLERNEWPSYQHEGAEYLDLSPWKRRQLDETYGAFAT